MTVKQDHSYGVIPLQRKKGVWYVLLVQLHAGHWGFPKGHPNRNETPFESASRELLEETGMKIGSLLSDRPLEESYSFKHEGQLVEKKVTYFMAEVDGDLLKQDLEVKAIEWLSLDNAKNRLTFEQARNILVQVAKKLGMRD